MKSLTAVPTEADMVTIDVKLELGNAIVTREDGRKLRTLVEAGLGNAPVIIDFGGLQVTSVSFFDEAFGQLALRWPQDKLLQSLKFERIDPFDRALVNDIMISRFREADRKNV